MAKTIANKSASRFCSLAKKKTSKVLRKDIDGLRAELIILNSNKWANGTTLRYFFFNDETEGAEVENAKGKKVWKTYMGTKEQMNVVRKAFDIWIKTGIGLKFKEVKDRKKAEIRIAFLPDGDSWSYIGRDILLDDPDPRTMNFGWNIAVKDRHNGIDTALHEIGHTLGFPHEHQNPIAGIKWNKEKVYKSLSRYPNYWSKSKTYENIIKKIKRSEVRGGTWDPDSIMHYPFEPGLVQEPVEFKKKGIKPAGGLSQEDIQYALFFYPKKNAAKDIRVTILTSYPIDAENSKQQNFIFNPTESREFTIQTVGQIDTVIVLSEKKSKGELYKIASDDKSGTDENALIKASLTKGKNYLIHVKVYYKKPGQQTALLIS